MTRESEISAYLAADATLAAILLGGIYTSGDLGIEGLGESSTPDAFVDGVLLPTAIVKEQALVPFGEIVDLQEQVTGASQRIETWLYADVNDQAAMRLASNRLYTLLHGYPFDAAFKTVWTFQTPVMPELCRYPLGAKFPGSGITGV